MAHIALQMTATAGFADEHCTGCLRAFLRGETMNGVQYENDDPAGWFCDDCIESWQQQGKPPGLETEQ
jgi:hypothetical protein